MKRAIALLILVFCSVAAPAHAALTETDLRKVGFDLPSNARIPDDVVVRDADDNRLTLGGLRKGTPAILLFADYKCETLCGMILTQLTDALGRLPLRIGSDYQLVVVGLDPSQSAQDVRAFRNARVGGTDIAQTANFLRTEGKTELSRLSSAIGLSVAWDAEHRQFAHPAAVLIVDNVGRVTRVLETLAVEPRDLTLAISEANDPPNLSLTRRLLLTCYGWDAAHGIYTLRVRRILATSCALFVVALGIALMLLTRWAPAPANRIRP